MKLFVKGELAVDRRILFRWIASSLLWLLIITVVIVSIRSTNIVSRTGQVAKEAMTAKEETQISSIRETAKAFAVEWGTWSGDQNDYQKRLGVFLKGNISVPEGVQEITSASVTSIIKEGNVYRVQLLLHARQTVNVALAEAQSMSMPQVYAPVTREDLRQTSYSNDNRLVPTWRNAVLSVEVPVKIQNNNPVITNLPVMIATEDKSGQIASPGYHGNADPELVAFMEQFLDLYYRGGSIKNFTTPEANLKSLSGWKLETIKEIRVDSDRSPTKAYIQVLVSAPGVDRLTQNINLKIKPSGSSYLVDKLSSTD